MSKTTRIVHVKKEPYDVYIGRPGKWGNPFELSNYSKSVSINKYKQWITKGSGRYLLKSIVPELQGKTLGCWCKPRSCHGDILIDAMKDILAMLKQIEILHKVIEDYDKVGRKDELSKAVFIDAHAQANASYLEFIGEINEVGDFKF